MPRPFAPALLAVLLVAAPGLAGCADDRDAVPAEPVAVASAAELTDRMLARFDDSFGGAESFAVLVGGYRATYTLNPDTTALERFRVTISATDSASTDPAAQLLVSSQIPNVPLLAQGFREAAFSGPFERDGTPVYMLESDRAGAAVGAPQATDDLENTQMRIYVDARTFDVREIYRAVPLDSIPRPITMRLIYDDFRTENGVRLPWRMRQIQTGFDQLIDPDMKMVQGGQLGLRRERLNSQPASAERDAELARVERDLRMLTEGVDESEITVSRVLRGDEE